MWEGGTPETGLSSASYEAPPSRSQECIAHGEVPELRVCSDLVGQALLLQLSEETEISRRTLCQDEGSRAKARSCTTSTGGCTIEAKGKIEFRSKYPTEGKAGTGRCRCCTEHVI